jgi:hypothetical protein
MNYLNNDFDVAGHCENRVEELHKFHLSKMTQLNSPTKSEFDGSNKSEGDLADMTLRAGAFSAFVWKTLVISERKVLNYFRNVFAYGLRSGIYGGMCSTSESVDLSSSSDV